MEGNTDWHYPDRYLPKGVKRIRTCSSAGQLQYVSSAFKRIYTNRRPKNLSIWFILKLCCGVHPVNFVEDGEDKKKKSIYLPSMYIVSNQSTLTLCYWQVYGTKHDKNVDHETMELSFLNEYPNIYVDIQTKVCMHHLSVEISQLTR